MALPVIAITNQSTVVSDNDVQRLLPALQKQVSSDFFAYWNQDGALTWLPKDNPLTAGWWQIVVLDDPDEAGALGYHELSSVGTPLGKVFAKLDINSGSSWTCTLSHELLEMLADPDINLCAQADDGKIYSYEVGDPVEADILGYEIDGVLLSDFVTPKWFSPSVFGDRVDFKRRISKPFEIAPDGYISIFDPANGWTEVQARHSGREHVGSAAAVCPLGSRRQRRTNKAQWRLSEK
jgi:hypothetical protein